MTILIAGTYGAYGIIGADKRTSTEGDDFEITCKLALHPTKAIAMGVMGLHFIPNPLALHLILPAAEYLRLQLADMQIGGAWSGAEVAHFFAGHVHPAVLETERLEHFPGTPEEVAEYRSTYRNDLGHVSNWLQLLTVTAGMGRADLFHTKLHRQIVVEPVPPMRVTLLARTEIQAALPKRDAFKRLGSTRGPYDAARAVRAAILDAITLEAEQNGGKNIYIGGGADVAIVDAFGARLWTD